MSPSARRITVRKTRLPCMLKVAVVLETAAMLNLACAFAPSVHQRTRRVRPAIRTNQRRHQIHRMVANAPDSVVESVTTQSLLDQILNDATRTTARKPIIMEFDPASKAIWKHWKGTIFQETYVSAIRHGLWAALVFLVFQRYPPAKDFLKGFGDLWGHVLSVTTFTLSFFVNQAYTLWRTCLNTSRILQGRINDLMMALSTHAARNDPESHAGCSEYSSGARKFLTVVARHIRLFHVFCYGSFTRAYRPLLTPRGMRRMVERGLLTSKERQVLVNAKVAATQRFNIILMWVLRSVVEARKTNLLPDGGPGWEQGTIDKIQQIRAQANTMECELRGRMPFAYAHVVQVLVDAVLWSYPIAAYTSGTSFQLGVLGAMFLTICYQGLFDLSKQFLDPYHNEGFWNGEDAIMVDTLVAETNAGSMRWVYGLDEMPIPYKAFSDCDHLDEYILPDEGYSVEEAQEMLEQNRLDDLTKAIKDAKSGMSAEYYERKAQEIKDAEQWEYEETQRILNAPAAADFVPGLDDGYDLDEEEWKQLVNGTSVEHDEETSSRNGTASNLGFNRTIAPNGHLGTDQDGNGIYAQVVSGRDRYRQYVNASVYEHDNAEARAQSEMVQKPEPPEEMPNGEGA